MKKNYKISKHPNKIYIQQKYAKNNNILKLSSNKKKIDLLTCVFGSVVAIVFQSAFRLEMH